VRRKIHGIFAEVGDLSLLNATIGTKHLRAICSDKIREAYGSPRARSGA
jgi:hypothetical protein